MQAKQLTEKKTSLSQQVPVRVFPVLVFLDIACTCLVKKHPCASSCSAEGVSSGTSFAILGEPAPALLHAARQVGYYD